MTYYHGSPVGGLCSLQPARPRYFEKESCVYLSNLAPMALMYGIRNFEYTYGYTKDGVFYFAEYFPGALELLYGGKPAWLYVCNPGTVEPTRIPNEWISRDPVEIVEAVEIPDLLEALRRQEAAGAIRLRSYGTLPQKMRDWIVEAEAETIQKHGLLHTPGPFADYMKAHYPESWERAKGSEEGNSGKSLRKV